MANGKPGDHPVTDTVLYGAHPYPPELERLVREVHARNPGVFNDLEWAPFHWEKGKYIPEAERLLRGLLENHGDPMTCRRLIAEYRDASKDDSRNV